MPFGACDFSDEAVIKIFIYASIFSGHRKYLIFQFSEFHGISNDFHSIRDFFKDLISQMTLVKQKLLDLSIAPHRKFKTYLVFLRIIFYRIAYRVQFHQHFTRAFFTRKCFAQLFSSYILVTKSPFVWKTLTKKCWWNWLQVCADYLHITTKRPFILQNESSSVDKKS